MLNGSWYPASTAKTTPSLIITATGTTNESQMEPSNTNFPRVKTQGVGLEPTTEKPGNTATLRSLDGTSTSVKPSPGSPATSHLEHGTQINSDDSGNGAKRLASTHTESHSSSRNTSRTNKRQNPSQKPPALSIDRRAVLFSKISYKNYIPKTRLRLN